METVETLLNLGKKALKEQKNPLFEAQILLAHVLECERVKLITWPEKEVSDPKISQYKALIARRQLNEPIAYLLGYREFWSLCFEVTPDTLVPRYETELLVETLLTRLPEGPLVIADVGTGSGVIACALASSRSQWRLIATDISEKALIVAKRNARNLHLSQITFMQSNWLEALKGYQLDAIVSNPPYIRDYDLHLMHGDLLYEPRIALTPGPKGLEAFQQIIAQSPECLKPGGWLAFEHGFDQASDVQAILAQAGFTQMQTYQDLAGLERVTIARSKV